MPSLVHGAIEGVFVAEAGVADGCDRCGATRDLLRIARGNARNVAQRVLQLCSDCLAECLDVVTGYPVQAQVARWRAFSAASSELQAASRQSIKTKQKQRERESKREVRRQGGLK